MDAMNNHALAVSSCLSVLVLLTACTTQFKYQEEPGVYPSSKNKVETPYLELAFPVNKSQQLALQLALVKYKKQAAKQERWLLLHQVPYQWVWVKWQGEHFHLLAAGPFDSGQTMMDQRRLIQQGIDVLDSMPAIALLTPNEGSPLSSEALAENSAAIENTAGSELKSGLKRAAYPN